MHAHRANRAYHIYPLYLNVYINLRIKWWLSVIEGK